MAEKARRVRKRQLPGERHGRGKAEAGYRSALFNIRYLLSMYFVPFGRPWRGRLT